MQAENNRFVLDLRDNPALKAAFADKKVGDKGEIEISFQIIETTDDRIVASIDEIEMEGIESEQEGEEEGEMKADARTPVMIAIGKMVGGRTKEGKGMKMSGGRAMSVGDSPGTM